VNILVEPAHEKFGGAGAVFLGGIHGRPAWVSRLLPDSTREDFRNILESRN
jgi:hypothetical protein